MNSQESIAMSKNAELREHLAILEEKESDVTRKNAYRHAINVLVDLENIVRGIRLKVN